MENITGTVVGGSRKVYDPLLVAGLFDSLSKEGKTVYVADERGTASRWTRNERGNLIADPTSTVFGFNVDEIVKVDSFNAVGPYSRMAVDANGFKRVLFIREDKVTIGDAEQMVLQLCVGSEWIQ